MASSPSILSQILKWSLDIPLWQRDALRRIVTSDSLTEDDLEDPDVDEDELNRIMKFCDVTDAHDKPRAAQGVFAKPADFEQELKDTKALVETLKGKKRKPQT